MYDNNVLYAFVGATFVTALPAADGQIAIEHEDGTFDGSGDGQNFRIVKYNSQGNLEHSPWITPGKQLAKNVAGLALPVQDVWTLTCDAGVEKDELKSIWLVVQDTLTTFGNKSMMKNAVTKTAVATETGTVIAAKLKASFDLNMVREPEPYVGVTVSTDDLIFTGKARTNFKPGIWKSMTYTFKLLGDDVGTVVHTTEGHGGTNTQEQIKEAEWFYQGHRGYGYRVDFLPVDSQLSSQAIYDILCAGYQECTYLQWKDQNFVNVVGQEPASLIEAKIFLPSADTPAGTPSVLFNTALDSALAG